MNESQEKVVMDYINRNINTNLYFSYDDEDDIIDYSSKLTITEKFTLEQVIYDCLNLARTHNSVSKNDWETEEGAARSSIDIWRHLKTYNPNLSIIDVINIMYNMGMEGILVGHFCSTVRRRVFKLAYFEPEWKLLATKDKDEYGLIFDEWKKGEIENVI